MARPRDPEFLERLARAGMRVFARKGFARARMSDVAAEMGVSHGTLYNYVESKEALFYLLIDWGMREEPITLPAELPVTAPPHEQILRRLEEQIGRQFRLSRLDAALAREEPPEDAARELREVLEEFYDRTAETREPADVVERSVLELPEMFVEFFLEVRRSVYHRFSRYIESRVEWGLLRPPVDTRVAGRILVETVTFFARHRHRDPDPDALKVADEKVRRTTVDMLASSLLGAPDA